MTVTSGDGLFVATERGSAITGGEARAGAARELVCESLRVRLVVEA